jgi:hypothetical protein
MGYDHIFAELKSAVGVLIERRPHIRVFIPIHGSSDMKKAKPCFALRDAYPTNVKVMMRRKRDNFPTLLSTEHDDDYMPYETR